MDSKALFLREFINETIYQVPEPAAGLKDTDYSKEKNNSAATPLSGDISAGTLLLFAYPEENDIPQQDKDFLTLLLKAVHLGWNKVAWKNLSSFPEPAWEAILEWFGGTRIIIFDPNFKAISQELNEGKPVTLEGRKVLATTSIRELEKPENNSRKKLLWKGLQELFGL